MLAKREEELLLCLDGEKVKLRDIGHDEREVLEMLIDVEFSILKLNYYLGFLRTFFISISSIERGCCCVFA
jgi:hypothetical protein